ncbi:MAG: hypothetical protein ABIS01_02495 [Ferruginibacter sp.]
MMYFTKIDAGIAHGYSQKFYDHASGYFIVVNSLKAKRQDIASADNRQRYPEDNYKVELALPYYESLSNGKITVLYYKI